MLEFFVQVDNNKQQKPVMGINQTSSTWFIFWSVEQFWLLKVFRILESVEWAV